jgi:hypothetical protein
MRAALHAYRRFLLIGALSLFAGLLVALVPVATGWWDWSAQPDSTQFVLTPAGYRYVPCGQDQQPYPDDPSSTCGKQWHPDETITIARPPFDPRPDWTQGVLVAGVCYLVVAGLVLSARALRTP